MSVGTQPGPYTSPNAPGAGAPIKNWLVESIIVTLCCGCWPLGVVAIIFAAQVNSKLAAGDRAGAEEAAKKAKMFVIIAAVAGAIAIAISVILNIGLIAGGAAMDANNM
jgi:hypothetical protein